jgi:hypothetical protein
MALCHVFSLLVILVNFATLLLEEWENDIHTPKMGKFQSSIAGVKTPRMEAFLISLESYQNVDVENALA